jgi:hypothetical protein
MKVLAISGYREPIRRENSFDTKERLVLHIKCVVPLLSCLTSGSKPTSRFTRKRTLN